MGQAEVMIERHENFVKQSYRNRCLINTTQGKAALIIPTTGKHGKTLITDVKIDHTQKWVNNHWRTIVSAYRNSPFFEFYADELEHLLYNRQTFLYDFNFNLLSMCLKWLKLTTVIKETLSYEKSFDTTINDMRSLINAKKSKYLEQIYKPVPYYQVFGNTFVENLSLIDLIFCCGPEAGRIVKSSVAR